MTYSRYIAKWALRWLLAIYRRGNGATHPIFCVPGDHIGDEIFLDGIYESDLLHGVFNEALGHLRSHFMESSCLDVGANIGNHAVYFSDRFNSVHAFEPNPIFSGVASATLRLNGIENVIVHNVGLGNAAEVLDYVVADSRNLGVSHFVSRSKTETGSPALLMRLEIVPGDQFLSGICLNHIALIKIDVEGFEEDVLRGLQKTIAKYSPILLFESHPEDDYEKAARIVDLLRSWGYDYMYEYDRIRAPIASKFGRIIFRVVFSPRMKLRAVNKLARRAYLMIIASKRSLTASPESFPLAAE